MADKLKRASDYESKQVRLVRATCLYVATKLGDMMDDLVIVGPKGQWYSRWYSGHPSPICSSHQRTALSEPQRS